jgi:dihydrofolate synthase/folylpolyglutamate synthase
MAIEDLPRQPTFFEFTTAMAFDAFARHQVQWAVIETGMGGRLDATNVLQPEISIITNISLEHKQYLGKTLPLIAGEKAGIIKTGIPVVSGVRQKSARQVIEHQASTRRARLVQWGRDFKTRRHPSSGFNYIGLYNRWSGIQLNLAGEHQVDNAALVLAACELLAHGNHVQIGETAIRRGLSTVSWPGRLEIALKEPCLILDGAHNLMSARILGRYLTRHLADRHITLVVGILDDKPYNSILKDLITPCKQVIVTQPKIDRAIPVERLEIIAKAFNPNVTVKKDVAEAVRYAIATARPQDVICVAGSLYVVGEAKTALADMGI